jgi:hypothetical protein
MSGQLQLLNPIARTQFVTNYPVVKEPAVNFSEHKDNSIESALENIFDFDKAENKLARARKILGDVATSLSDSELQAHLTEFEFLLDCWMDEFERQIFNNKTLREVLREG